MKIVINLLRTLIMFKYKKINHGSIPIISGKLLLDNKGEITIGNRFKMINTQFKTQLTVAKNAKLKIGDDVFINQGCNIYAKKSIYIGKNVSLGDLVMMHDTNFHEVNENEGVTVKPIIIEDNVWIGARSIILPGVHIGKNSIVGAGSIVTKSFPENCLIGGNPAKIIKKLNFSKKYIRK